MIDFGDFEKISYTSDDGNTMDVFRASGPTTTTPIMSDSGPVHSDWSITSGWVTVNELPATTSAAQCGVVAGVNVMGLFPTVVTVTPGRVIVWRRPATVGKNDVMGPHSYNGVSCDTVRAVGIATWSDEHTVPVDVLYTDPGAVKVSW